MTRTLLSSSGGVIVLMTSAGGYDSTCALIFVSCSLIVCFVVWRGVAWRGVAFSLELIIFFRAHARTLPRWWEVCDWRRIHIHLGTRATTP